jgi:large subunit ribosomal protein L3
MYYILFKAKKMAGHMGNVRSTIQNLQIVRVDSEKNLILILIKQLAMGS